MNYEQTVMEHVQDLITADMGRKTAVIVGAYSGTSSTTALHHIELGCKPLAVHIEEPNGARQENTTRGILFTRNCPYGNFATIDDTGFSIRSGSLCQLDYGTHIFVAYVENI